MGFVASSNLNFDDLFNDISHCLDVGAATTRSPVSDVELTHIEGLTRLYTECVYVCTAMCCENTAMHDVCSHTLLLVMVKLRRTKPV